MSAPQRILIVRPSALGDVSRTVPALVTLKKAFPDARIDWLVQAGYAPAIAGHPDLWGVVPFHRRPWWKSIGLMRHLRRQRYDTVFDLQGLARSALFTFATGAKERIGFANARELGYLAYNHRHRLDPAMHTVDRMLGLLQSHGLPIHHDMRLHLTPGDRDWLTGFLKQHDLSDGRFAVIAPTAQWLCKCWPIDRFAEVAGRLLDLKSAGEPVIKKIIVLAAPHETSLVEPLLHSDSLGRIVKPATHVGQMMALISACRILICNDSAALHMGVGFDRAIVCAFGPTDPAKVGPYRRRETIVQPDGIQPHELSAYRRMKDDQSLIARITVEKVWQKVDAQLQR